jgi:hypothetical protein
VTRRPDQPNRKRTPTEAQRRAFQGSRRDPEKAAKAKRDRTRAPLTPAEREVLAELLGERRPA